MERADACVKERGINDCIATNPEDASGEKLTDLIGSVCQVGTRQDGGRNRNGIRDADNGFLRNPFASHSGEGENSGPNECERQ